jgi:hypothetical protein
VVTKPRLDAQTLNRCSCCFRGSVSAYEFDVFLSAWQDMCVLNYEDRFHLCRTSKLGRAGLLSRENRKA